MKSPINNPVRILKIAGVSALAIAALTLTSCHRHSYRHGHPAGAAHGAFNHHSHTTGQNYSRGYRGGGGYRSADYCPY
ncbi:MAG: hypothetical protein AAF585_26455 [Verrucomicrobiota bacterium]